MKQELLTQLEALTRGAAAFEPVVKKYIQDETQPLDDRWEVFKAVPNGMLSDRWIQHYKFDGMEISWYDDHYIERHETVDNLEIIERYEENLGEGNDYMPFRTEVTQEKIDKLKSDMLLSGIRFWEYDW